MILRRRARRRVLGMARDGVRRGLVVMLGLQAVVVVVLSVVDSWRRRVRPQRQAFPRTPPDTMAVGESEMTVYTFGRDLFDDMLASIRSARSTIMLATYIIKNDEVGSEFKAALVEASERGVEVHVVYDGFANLVVPRRFFRFPALVNVLRYPVVHVRLLLGDLRKSGRDHRKLLVVDDEVGYIGGYNIGSDYADHWRDTHVRVRGPAVWDLENAFVDFWNEHRQEGLPILSDPGASTWDPSSRVYRNSPSRTTYPIRGMYLEAIDRASQRIWITAAYFIPDGDILRALLAAADRGVDVRVLVPEVSNHVVADWLSRGFYSSLLRGGVQIWLYQSMVHAKTATIDGRWTTIGTANIDRLSLTGNYEVNLEVVDSDVARHMEGVFASDLSNSRQLTFDEWRRRRFAARFAEVVLAPLRPLL